MKVLFVLKQPGDVRLLGSVLDLLSERGHRVHLAFQAVKTSESRAALEELARGRPGITFGKAPSAGSSRWNHLARALRLAADYLRYLEPLFAEAPKLRENVERQVAPVTRALGRLAARGGPGFVSKVRRTLQASERCIPPSRRVEQFIAEHQPDVLLVSPLVGVGSTQADFLRAGKRLGVRTGYVLMSWDNLTTKGLMRDVPDLALVWNEIQADEAVRLHRVPRERIRVAGAWCWDHWFDLRPERTREAFCREVGLRADSPIVLYVGSSWWVLPDEVGFVRRWIDALRAKGGVLAHAGILVRPHPMRRDSSWREAQFDDPQVAVWPRSGEQLLGGATRRNFYDSIYHASAVFGINTSAQIEAAIVGRPVLTLLSEEFKETQQGTVHFHYMKDEAFGHLHVAETLQDHAAQLEAILGGEGEGDRTERFVRRFARPFGLEVSATPLAADAIEELASWPPPAPAAEPSYAPLVRFAMRPLAGAAARAAARRQEAKPATLERELRHMVRRLAREGRPVVAGPWLGDEVGELLYWIPFLRWSQTATFGLRERLRVVARARSCCWYEGIGGQLVVAGEVDAFEDPADFSRLPAELVERMRPELSRQEPVTRIQHRLLEFAPLEVDRPVDLELPEDYVAVRFAFRGAFTDGREEHEAALGAVRLLAERAPVVLLDPPETLARGLEPQIGDGHVWTVAPADPQLEAAVLRRASGFLGSFGASAFVAALSGTPAVALYSRPTEGVAADLRLARAFLARPPFGRVEALEVGPSSEETARRAVELLQTPERLVAHGA